ncbi:acyltransferase family protein [Bowmanella denitrificans]|uniref:acyltransferase family protein n=1 Tax=Bowmanella denitrificans TaxID=366582 RepID=UPI000C9BC725|nr:acyltransferase family protein [Bowmanella denitrificans]
MLSYRKEIDGLRAVAVMPVLFFHAGFPGFNGGFIGVDIFFVLSGYLITSIILDDLAKNRFSIVNFYERRARRILPALFFMLAVTTLLAYCLLSASELEHFARSALAVIAFVSNIFFYFDAGYFNTTAEEFPLLHTWSLAVEEQFYIFFPLLIASLWQTKKHWMGGCILALAALSFAWALWLAASEQSNANFYLIFSRSWELMAGALAALINRDKLRVSVIQREAICLTALLVLLVSFYVFNSSYSWPGPATLLPVAATVALILYCTPATMVAKLLIHPWMVFLGLISYSLYLWHQPIFALVRAKSLSPPTPTTFALLIMLSITLAYFSWRFVEAPFRNKEKVSRTRIFVLSGAGMAFVALVMAVLSLQNGLPERFEVTDYTASVKSSPYRQQCHTSTTQYLMPQEACRYFTPNTTWAVFGDSHGVELAYSLGEELDETGEGLLHLTFSSCPPAQYLEIISAGCKNWLADSIDALTSNQHITNVVLNFRYNAYLNGFYRHQHWTSAEYFLSGPSKALSLEEVREKYWQGFEEIIDSLLKAGKHVFVIYPVPELRHHIQKLVVPKNIFSNSYPLNLQQQSSVTDYQNDNQFILKKLNALPFSDKLTAIHTADLFCQNMQCAAVKNGHALYFDDNHPSLYGAKLIARKITQHWQRAQVDSHGMATVK